MELLSQPYNFSFASIANKKIFVEQIKQENKILNDVFGVKPKAFKNTQLLFNDDLSDTIVDLGYNTMIIEGARHLLGWKPAENVYYSAVNPHLKLLTRTYGLCDDISFRFGNQNWDQWPLTAEKYITWMKKSLEKGKCLTMALEYETFGDYYKPETGIIAFMEDLIKRIVDDDTMFMATPTEIAKKIQPSAPLNVPYNMTWADEEKDTSAWLGNELQQESFKQLYDLGEKVLKCRDKEIKKDFTFLQSVDNLIYMCTKFFVVKDAIPHLNSPYDTPYQAFINFMNIVSDLRLRLESKTNKRK